MKRPISARGAFLRAAAAFACALTLALSAACSALGGAGTGGQASSSGTRTAGGGAAAVATATILLAGKVAGPPTGAYLGVYVPPAPFDSGTVRAFDSLAGKGVSIVMWFQPWVAGNRNDFDTAACLEVMREGKVPMITWESWDPGNNAKLVKNPGQQPNFKLKAILNGNYDGYIRDWARKIKQLGGPVMLRPMHEMNGDWYPWSGTTNGNSPSEYVAAWKRIHDIFRQEGATNVTWVWSINSQSVPDTPENRYAAYYPGDEYVDWTAISGFNVGTSVPNSRWNSFSSRYDRPLVYLETLPKPICIVEFGSVELGGDKAAWLTDAYSRVALRPSVKAIVYYQAIERTPSWSQDFRIDTSPKSLAAFRKAVSSEHYLSQTPLELMRWAGTLTGDQLRYLTSIPRKY